MTGASEFSETSRNQEQTQHKREPGPEGGTGGAKGENNATTHSNGNKPGPAARRGELRGREGRTAAGATGGGLRQGDQPRGLACRNGNRGDGEGARPGDPQCRLPEPRLRGGDGRCRPRRDDL